MTDFSFVPSLQSIGSFTKTATIEEIANETGMFSASPNFVAEHGGPLTQEILAAIPNEWYAEAERLGLYPNIDVRVHRLYQDDYPAVPGWHCDGEFRENYHSQPDLTKVPTHRHLVGTVSTDVSGVSLTEFVTDPVTIPIDLTGTDQGIWEQVHHWVDEHKPQTQESQDGLLYDFSSWTLHRCTPAKIRGWRLFFRASMWHKPYLDGEGTLARQEYVYRVSEAKGW